MVYLGAFISAIVTGALIALAVRVMAGINHVGILVAVAFMAGGIQMVILISWYLHHTKAQVGLEERREDTRN